MKELEPQIALLTQSGVDFVIVGGVAVVAHGADYLTHDLDVCYSRAAGRPKDLLVIPELEAILESQISES